MKQLVKANILVSIVVLLMLLFIGVAAASPPQKWGGSLHGKPPDNGPTEEGATLNEPAPTAPSGTAVKINFEMGGQKARKGTYVIEDLDGNQIATWYAREGEVDSGWFEDLDFQLETILVRVYYYSEPGAKAVLMRILNHHPDRYYGWISQGIPHSLEVAFWDEPVMIGRHRSW